MARPPRIEYEGAVYHVTARGNERRQIFFMEDDYEKFIYYLVETKKKYNINIHCYTLMRNHYHLIIETPEANLSKAMHYINSSYAGYINIKRRRSGHLLQGRYKSIIVDEDNYLLELSRYIHLNPVRAGMVQKPEDYLYSSYSAYIKNKRESVLTKKLVLGLMTSRNGNARKEYRIFVESAIGREPDSLLENVYGGTILGDPIFIKEVLRRIKEDYYTKEEVSNKKALMAASGIEEIVASVADYYNMERDELMKSKSSVQRKIAIYLMKERTGSRNGEIGEYFEGLSGSAVRKVYQRFKNDMKANRKLRRHVIKIESNMSRVRG